MRVAAIAGRTPTKMPVSTEYADGNPQHARVGRDVVQPRQVGRRQLHQRRHTPARQQQPGQPAHRGEQQPFGERLLIIRRRPAPSATRVASSFCRAMLRANTRFATFTAAMIRTKATPASSTRSGPRIDPTV